MSKREQINFRLDAELNEILQEKCEELGITKTEFAKRALQDALGLPTNISAKPVRLAIQEIQARLTKVEEQIQSCKFRA
jgi:antitoxin component of RelBE/YafQ-DinJ toxin-antitoxin module